ncbi:MAG: GH92 family glycosyl hydrolase [Gemmatimonadota bacterium]
MVRFVGSLLEMGKKPGWAPVRFVALLAALTLASGEFGCTAPPDMDLVTDPASYVDPFIGTANGGNTFPGAVLPFGMVQFSPETTRGDATRRPAPGGYQYDATTVRGFSLTHLSGTGCRGASGDVPILPYAGEVTSSPSADSLDRIFVSRFSHANEMAIPGYYQVRSGDGVNTEVTASLRTGSARFTFPAGEPAKVLIRVSDSEVGSGDAYVEVDSGRRSVTGWVSSGNFCGYIDPVIRHDYYTLHFVAEFDNPFTEVGSWEDETLSPGSTSARGGTTYGEDGYPVAGLGSGAWVGFGEGPPGGSTTVNVRVGISYVSLENARANLEAENPAGTSFEALRKQASDAWNGELRRIEIGGGTEAQRTVFYTALYHSLLHMNVFSDVNGEYWGFDGNVHAVAPPQGAQHANFSGWDVYRSQVQLVALLNPDVASDMAQSLYNQANQNGGVWDRWTHNTGATHVMAGDPSAPTVAGILAFGGDRFDVDGAYASLLRAATVPTELDLSDEGCRVMCPGQRPSLDQWLSLGYLATESNSWGGAGESLEDAIADFSLSRLALRRGDEEAHEAFMARAGNWRNLFNPDASPEGGYIQNRNSDRTWPAFDPGSSRGFAEGSSAQYTWMIPHDARGLFDAMGGDEVAVRRLDEFFHNDDGSWALTRLGSLKSDVSNEPSVGAPWMYLFAGRPDKTQSTVREALNVLWTDRPHGMPGNDDLGAMSSWYVWAALGLYPGLPGGAELLVGSPLFPHAVVRRANGVTLTVRAPEARPRAPFVNALRVGGNPWTKTWLPETFVTDGGELVFDLSDTPNLFWGTGPEDTPPSGTPQKLSR